jgi:dipeptidyl aminopeptidase/acylaminoacyl peptidase
MLSLLQQSQHTPWKEHGLMPYSKTFRAFGIMSILFTSGASAILAQEVISGDKIATLQSVYEFALSPDGKQAAIVMPSPAAQGAPGIWIKSTSHDEALKPLEGALPGDYAPNWSPDGRNIAFLSGRQAGGNTGPQVFVTPNAGGGARCITDRPGGIFGFVWSPDSSMIAFLAPDLPGQKQVNAASTAILIDQPFQPSRLWITDVASGKTVMAVKLKDDIQDFAWAPDGKHVALITKSAPAGNGSFATSLVIADRQSSQLPQTLDVSPAAAIPGFAGVHWSPDGKWIAFRQKTPEPDAWGWAVVSPEGGTAHPLLRDYLGDVLHMEFQKDSKRAFAQLASGTRQALVSLSTTDDMFEKIADVSISVGEASFTSNGDRLLYLSQTETSSADLWTARPGDKPLRLTNLNPATSLWAFGSVSEIDWTNRRDGLALHGVVIKPVGFQEGHRYPMIVLMHPGNQPWWNGFHAAWWDWGQLLAARGYVVFMPNYRGVSGLGWKMDGLIREWGTGLAYEDMMDGVDFLIQKGFIDENRLGIGGWSHGGFMTEWSITHTNRFKAAVVLSGPSDFATVYSKTIENARLQLRDDFGASPFEARAQYDASSPLTYVRSCRTPTLLLHGQEDVAVPVEVAYEFHAALQELGVETNLVVYANDGHAITNRDNQIDVQNRVLGWFDAHLK